MTPTPLHRNTLFYGDNLPILRDHIPDESVDLIYLDPPFNSNRSYNVLFKSESGNDPDSQIQAFDDTWHWGESAEAMYDELTHGQNQDVAGMISALRQFIHENQMMAYLVMMAARLIELHRVLKPTGSLYLHCDPTASHYLKVVLDTIFGVENFRNEIVWCYTRPSSPVKQFPRTHDDLFFYTKTDRHTFNRDDVRIPYDEETIARSNRNPGNKSVMGGKGTDRLNPLGKIPESWWPIPMLQGNSNERLGYPTQKPLALLERIIQASSNPGDIVLDPFSGCGTSIAAAQKLGRRWIGIDITHLAIEAHKRRLREHYTIEPGKDYDVIGEPEDLTSARQLARDDRYQFQWWALSLIKARPLGGSEGSKVGKKGSDKGIDGLIPFIDDASKKLKHVIVSVKSGHVNSPMLRDLHGVIDREVDAPIGVFITLEEPTSDMKKEAVSAGFYKSDLWQKQYPRLQILTIEQLLAGEEVKMPPQYGTFKKAEKVRFEDGTQSELGL
ncbi:MAG: site-specific DNA-methyltransferase [Anaerolinea sp.]|nr:site-specific DNA-methyltransferase [Anaerolinea sp.]